MRPFGFFSDSLSGGFLVTNIWKLSRDTNIFSSPPMAVVWIWIQNLPPTGNGVSAYYFVEKQNTLMNVAKHNIEIGCYKVIEMPQIL